MASPSGRLPATPRGTPSTGTPSTRTFARPRERASQARVGRANLPDAVEDSGRVAQAVAAATQSSFRFTWRMIALVAVVVVLIISYASSLRVYFNQQSQLATARVQIAADQQNIGDLHDELARWKDPAYVQAQARARLGWVVPGEIGFQVIGTDGKPLSPAANIDAAAPASAPQQQQQWWDRLLGSAAAADNPVPVGTPTPSDIPTITVNTTPTPSDSPTS